MKTKLFISFLIIAAFVGCERGDSVQDQVNDVVVVNAFLEINKPIDAVVLSRLDPLDESLSQEAIIADVRILHQDDEFILEEMSPGVYGLDDPLILVAPNSNYELIIDIGNKKLSATTKTPQDHSGFTVTKSEINTNEAGDQIDITFTEVPGDDVFYLVKIIPLDETLLPVVVLNPSSRDEKSFFVYNGDNNIISILGTYFSYIGEHDIEIYRINEEFLPLFNAASSESHYLSAGNITNGLGSFVGTDRISVGIVVE